jgi:hypothetical protein
MSMSAVIPDYAAEEQLVAELELLGVRYLSRQTFEESVQVRPAEKLLADIVQQPSARVRAAVIAVLLAQPQYATAAPAAARTLAPEPRLTLKLFYTAARLLQQMYADSLQAGLPDPSHWLPDLFSAELGLSDIGTAHERLARLGKLHQRLTQRQVNWAGTYTDVARRLLRQWELEAIWNR